MSALKFHAEPDFDPEVLSADLAPLRAGERLRRLQERYQGNLVASTSFGLQSAVMLHLLHEHAPDVPVVFLDTGFHFPETYQYAEHLMNLLKIDLRIYQPTISAARMQALWGDLWAQGKEGADRYALLTKIEPMNRALTDLGCDVWISGLRRSHSQTRASRGFAERQKKTLKVYPILDWADMQVDVYMRDHDLPPHPLAAKGYVTMGDWHSTRPATKEEAEVSRFNGEKYECGLHLESSTSDFQI